MKKVYRIIAFLLCTALILSGCGNAAGTKPQTAADGKEVETVVFATWTINTVPSEEVIQSVEDAINAITVERDGIQVDLKLYPVFEYFNTVSLALQGGETIDVFTSYGNFNTCLAQDMCYDITDLVKVHAPGAVELVGEDWLEATSQNGKIYGIPAWMPVALAANFLYRTDIAEELDLDMSGVTCLEDMTDIFAKVKEAHPEMYGLIGGIGRTGLTTTIQQVDYLGDDMYSPAGVLIGDSTTVVNLFETEEYKRVVTLAREWYEKGYIMQDLATTNLTNIEILGAGNAFANITLQGSAPSVVASSSSAQTGYPLDSFFFGESYLDTASVNTNTWCVSSTSKVPEAALRFMNLIYTDPEIINLIVYGIEGRDYVVQEDGSVAPPEGLDATSVPYPGFYILTGSWGMGDNYRMIGTTAEAIDWNVEATRSANPSAALGFTFDSSSVKNEYTAVNNVISQFYGALECGSVDPEVELPKFIQALKEAGIDTIIAEKQRQLDAWLAANQ